MQQGIDSRFDTINSVIKHAVWDQFNEMKVCF